MSDFGLNSVQAQQAFNYDGIRELKTPLKTAINETKDNGLDEVFFKSNGKDYVAFGKGMDIGALKGSIPIKFEGSDISIVHIDNENNTASEGAKSALKSVAGKFVTRTSAIVGGLAGASGAGATVVGALGLSGAAASVVAGAGLAAVGVGAGAALTAGVGALKSIFKGADYESIAKIAK